MVVADLERLDTLYCLICGRPAKVVNGLVSCSSGRHDIMVGYLNVTQDAEQPSDEEKIEFRKWL